VGSLVELRGTVLQVRQCHIVVGVVGMPLEATDLPWMDGLFGFVQVDKKGLPVDLPTGVTATDETHAFWQPLTKRLANTRTHGATADWIRAGFGGG
jgi:hypothetical protein